MAGRFRPRRRGLVALSAVVALLLAGWLAPTPWLAGHWPRVLVVGLVLFVLVLARWFVPGEARAGLLQALVAGAVIAAVAVGWQELETDRRQLRAQLAAAGADQAAERFSRALSQLASPQPEVRLGGIYGLEQIAARSAEAAAAERAAFRLTEGAGPPPAGPWPVRERLQVFEILAAYVRAQSHRPPAQPAGSRTLQVRQADVQAALTVLARRTVLPGDPALDLNAALLAYARLGWARLGWARLAGADLQGADLRGAGLEHAELVGAHLEQALLCGAQLQGADLRGARLAGALASRDTRWPAGFDWRAAGARLVETC